MQLIRSQVNRFLDYRQISDINIIHKLFAAKSKNNSIPSVIFDRLEYLLVGNFPAFDRHKLSRLCRLRIDVKLFRRFHAFTLKSSIEPQPMLEIILKLLSEIPHILKFHQQIGKNMQKQGNFKLDFGIIDEKSIMLSRLVMEN